MSGLFWAKSLDFLINSKLFNWLHRMISYLFIKALWIFYSFAVEKGGLFKRSELNLKDLWKIRKVSMAFQGLDVAFICDGNRRWAKKQSMKNNAFSADGQMSVKDKISVGLEKIHQIIQVSYAMGLRSASFYIFAIRNFKRTDEINSIKQFLKECHSGEYPFKFKIYGDLSRFESPEIEAKILEAEKNSGANSKDAPNPFTVNIFISYNSTECDRDPNNTREYFNDNVDLIIRTSGEKRLSDFLVRHVAKGTAFYPVRNLWPDFTISHLMFVLLLHKYENKLLKHKKQ